MSLFSRFRHSVASHRRHARRRNAVSPTVGEVLEVRRLLTNAAPSLENIIAENGEISADVQDDGSGGQISVSLDVGNNGQVDIFQDSHDGASHQWNVGGLIPLNKTDVVKIVVTETPADGSAALSNTYFVMAEGLQLAEVSFSSLDSAPIRVLGTIGDAIDGVVGQLQVMYRELGSTAWTPINPAELNTDFDAMVHEADGVKDFEFVVANQMNGETTFGEVVALFDIPGAAGGIGSLLDDDGEGVFV